MTENVSVSNSWQSARPGHVSDTQAVTIASDAFRFAAPYAGMELIARAGTVIAYDDGIPVATPYDNCVLIMPSMRRRKGDTAVRLGRVVS